MPMAVRVEQRCCGGAKASPGAAPLEAAAAATVAGGRSGVQETAAHMHGDRLVTPGPLG